MKNIFNSILKDNEAALFLRLKIKQQKLINNENSDETDN